MCLGVPGRVVAVEGLMATVDFWGVRRRVNLLIVDQPVAPGDYVLNHVGYAIRKIPEADIEGTLALYDDLLAGAAASGPDDLMTLDVQAEIAAGGEEPT